MYTCLYFFRFIQIAFTHGTVSVERKNPRVGTSAFTNGLGNLVTKKNMTTTKYVRTRISSFLISEVSHALSRSTRTLRSLILSISFLSSSRVVIFFFDKG